MTLLDFKVVIMVVVITVVFFMGGWLALVTAKYFRKKSIKKRLNRGVQKEHEAFKWLKNNGFKILESQPKLQYKLKVNGESIPISVTPDFKVFKNGVVQFVEVKSGSVATKIQNKDTRRQLLEYQFINPNIPLSLLDMESKELKRIEFPFHPIKPTNKWLWFILGVVLATVFLLVIAYYFFKN